MIHEACTTGQDIISTCPDVWEWNKTFSNYTLDLERSMRMGTAMLVESTQTSPTQPTHSPVQSYFNTELQTIPLDG
jgi:hypothetical protein